MRFTILVLFLGCLFVASALSRKQSNADDIIDHVARFVLGPFSRDVFCAIEIPRTELSLDDLPEVKCLHIAMPENLFRVDPSEESSNDGKTSSKYRGLETVTDSTANTSLDSNSTPSPESSTKSSANTIESVYSYFPVTTTINAEALAESSAEVMVTNSNDIITLTRRYHDMRVSYTHTNDAQAKLISEHEKTIRSLQNEVSSLRAGININSECKLELAMTRRFVDMRRYSIGLQRRLREFQAFANSKK